MSIVHNLLRLLEAKLKQEEDIQDLKVINAWQKNLVKRAGNALKAERKFPEKLYKGLYRPTEVSLQFIHWLRVSLARPTCYRQAIKQLRPLCRLTSRILDDRVHYWEITALSALFVGW
jgi:hypothetical protein